MTDDSRLARLEQRVDTLDQRQNQTDVRVDALSDMKTDVAVFREQMKTLNSEFAAFRKDINDRDDETRRERRAQIRWAITLTVTILAALIGAFAVILSSGGHP